MEKIKPVTLIGAGSVGSFAALTLAKMGVPLVVWDDDRVEPHNLPNQFYPTKHLGLPKVEALEELLSEFAEVEVKVKNARFGPEDLIDSPIVAVTVDSMISRADIWEAVKKSDKVELFIDSRTGGQVIRLFIINPKDAKDKEWYEQFMYSDSEAIPEPCSARTIIYTPAIAGAEIAATIAFYLKDPAVDLPRHVMKVIPLYSMHIDGKEK